MYRFKQGTAVRVAVLCLPITLATGVPQALSFTRYLIIECLLGAKHCSVCLGESSPCSCGADILVGKRDYK